MAASNILNFTSTILHAVSYLLLATTEGNASGPSSGDARSLSFTPSFRFVLPENGSLGSDLKRGSQDKTSVVNEFPPYRTRNPNNNIPYLYEEQDSTTLFNMFAKILPNVFNNGSAKAYSAGREVNYYDGQTIATIHIDSQGKPARCNLIEANTEDERKRALDKFAESNRPVERTSFRIVLGIITVCQSLKTSNARSENSLNNFFRSQLGGGQQLIPEAPNVWSVASGILPGTKWCGLGDIAKNYDDLGQEKDLDKCCRAHDYCPVKVKAFRSGYGLVNWSLYTKSHCQCDSLLYDCLKSASTPTADVLGNVYFNVIRVQCVDEENPMKCVERDISTQKCKMWQPIQQKRMGFRNYFREY